MGLSPADFWSLSLAEWSWLCAAARGEAGAPTRADFAALAALYPDRKGNGHDRQDLA